MDLGFTNSVAVVTGAGAGIGLATARMLAEEGAHVALLGRRQETVDRAVAELIASTPGVDAIALECDVADEQAVQSAMTAIGSRWGRIDQLVLSAGVSGLYGKTIEQITTDEWDRLFDVNVKGQWLCVKHALPHLKSSAHPSVVIVASDSALVASPLHSAYCTSKGATVMLMKSLAVDLRDDGIRVNSVCPSVVNTGMALADLGLEEHDLDNADYPVQQAEDVARALVFLASPTTSNINAHALVTDFGYMAQSGFPS